MQGSDLVKIRKERIWFEIENRFLYKIEDCKLHLKFIL